MEGFISVALISFHCTKCLINPSLNVESTKFFPKFGHKIPNFGAIQKYAEATLDHLSESVSTNFQRCC